MGENQFPTTFSNTRNKPSSAFRGEVRLCGTCDKGFLEHQTFNIWTFATRCGKRNNLDFHPKWTWRGKAPSRSLSPESSSQCDLLCKLYCIPWKGTGKSWIASTWFWAGENSTTRGIPCSHRSRVVMNWLEDKHVRFIGTVGVVVWREAQIRWFKVRINFRLG